MGDLIEPAPPSELTQPTPAESDTEDEEDEDAQQVRAGSSAKIEQLVHMLTLTPNTEKSLVFSQFTGFLDKVGDLAQLGSLGC